MSSQGDLERTRAVLEETLRELRGQVRRTRVRQKLRRWCGRSFFRLERASRKPGQVHLAGLKVTPLWEIGESGPNDLDCSPRKR